MKKNIALFLVLVMALRLFAGCTPTFDDNRQPTANVGAATDTGVIDTSRDWWGEDDGKIPIKLRFWAAIDPVYGYQNVSLLKIWQIKA